MRKTLKNDKEGFYISLIDEDKCINCGVCYSKCPGRSVNNCSESEMGYLISLKDSKMLKSSASGGAFAGIASFMIQRYNAIAVGAAITENLLVKHILIKSLEELRILQNMCRAMLETYIKKF